MILHDMAQVKTGMYFCLFKGEDIRIIFIFFLSKSKTVIGYGLCSM